MTLTITDAKDAFLDLIADAIKFEEEPDGDTNEAGRQIDCTTYSLVIGWRSLADFCDTLGISQKIGESIGDAIKRTIEDEVRDTAATLREIHKSEPAP